MGQPQSLRQRHRVRVLATGIGWRHNAGSRCDVELDGDLLRFWIGDELVKTAARISTGGTKQTGPPHQCTGPNPTPECQGSTDSEQGHTDPHSYVGRLARHRRQRVAERRRGS